MNTPNKRASAIGIALAIRLVLPVPDASVDQPDRQQVAYSYAGVAAGNPVVASPDIVTIEATFRRAVTLEATVRRSVGLDATLRREIAIDVER